jgi:hypothetical protein
MQSQTREQNYPGFQGGNRRNQQALGAKHRCPKARAVLFIGDGGDDLGRIQDHPDGNPQPS